MARRPKDVEVPPVAFVDDGLSDDERAEALAKWFEEFDARPGVEVGVRAADTLAELRAEGEL